MFNGRFLIRQVTFTFFPHFLSSLRNLLFTLNVPITFEHQGRQFDSISFEETRSTTKGLRRQLISFPIGVWPGAPPCEKRSASIEGALIEPSSAPPHPPQLHHPNTIKRRLFVNPISADPIHNPIDSGSSSAPCELIKREKIAKEGVSCGGAAATSPNKRVQFPGGGVDLESFSTQVLCTRC